MSPLTSFEHIVFRSASPSVSPLFVISLRLLPRLDDATQSMVPIVGLHVFHCNHFGLLKNVFISKSPQRKHIIQQIP